MEIFFCREKKINKSLSSRSFCHYNLCNVKLLFNYQGQREKNVLILSLCEINFFIINLIGLYEFALLIARKLIKFFSLMADNQEKNVY